MKFLFIFIFCILIQIESIEMNAQVAKVSKPQIELNDNVFSIKYDILNSNVNDRFTINLDIEDSFGNLIIAKAVSGDIGNNIGGGIEKEIIWDLKLDSIYMEAMIYFQISAEAVVVEKTVVEITELMPQADSGKDPKIDNRTNAIEYTNRIPEISRSKALKQSLLFPGLGMTKVKPGKPHWLKGVLGYGCIATSAIFSVSSNSSYNEYLEATAFSVRNDLYDMMSNQQKASNVLLYSAISIWIVDFIWTALDTKELKHYSSKNVTKDFSLYASFENEFSAPMLALKFAF